ncbi:hypothetical protein LTR66_016808, partial [Elasticomyces elasticus]
MKTIWTHDKNTPASSASIWRALTQVSQNVSEPPTFVIDGLDEYQQQQHLRDEQALPADRRLRYDTITQFMQNLKDALRN